MVDESAAQVQRTAKLRSLRCERELVPRASKPGQIDWASSGNALAIASGSLEGSTETSKLKDILPDCLNLVNGKGGPPESVARSGATARMIVIERPRPEFTSCKERRLRRCHSLHPQMR